MESYDYTPICNYCSRDIAQVTRMVAGEECHICNHCIDALYHLVHQTPSPLTDGQVPSEGARLEFYRGRNDRH
jgi:ATP-dependent protease Clp ATPase subunit